MPSPAASSTGKMNTQKTASGSRKNSRYRTRVSCTRGCSDQRRLSLFTKMPTSQRYEYVLESCRVGPQLGQLGALAPKLTQKRGHGDV